MSRLIKNRTIDNDNMRITEVWQEGIALHIRVASGTEFFVKLVDTRQ